MPSVEAIIIAAAGGASQAPADAIGGGTRGKPHSGSLAEYAACYLAGLSSEDCDLLMVHSGVPDRECHIGVRKALLREARALSQQAARPWPDRMSVAIAEVAMALLQPTQSRWTAAARLHLAQQHGARMKSVQAWEQRWDGRVDDLKKWAERRIGRAILHILRARDAEHGF